MHTWDVWAFIMTHATTAGAHRWSSVFVAIVTSTADPRYSPHCMVVEMSDLRVSVDESALERLGRALADDSRRRILMELLDGPAYPAELAGRLGLGKANTSNHLSCLRGCGLVVAEPEGRRVRYELADQRLAVGLRTLADVMLSIDPCCRRDR